MGIVFFVLNYQETMNKAVTDFKIVKSLNQRQKAMNL